MLFTRSIKKVTFFLCIFLNNQNSYFLCKLLTPEQCLKSGIDTQFTNKNGRKKGHFHEELYLCTILVEDKFLPFLWNQSPPCFSFFFFFNLVFPHYLSSTNIISSGFIMYLFFLIDFFQSCSTLSQKIFFKESHWNS